MDNSIDTEGYLRTSHFIAHPPPPNDPKLTNNDPGCPSDQQGRPEPFTYTHTYTHTHKTAFTAVLAGSQTFKSKS